MIPAFWLGAVLAQAPATLDESEEIRILLGTGRAPLKLEAKGLASWVDDASPQPIADGRASLACAGAELTLGKSHFEAALDLAGEGPIHVLGRTLRGRVEVSCERGAWTAINVLPMETYLSAVLGGEMPSAFPPEALKAQAVAARSYALMRKIEAGDEGRPFHLSATVLSQVYEGLSHEDPRASAAVEATRGEVLAVGVTPVEAYFHSSCGGRTESGASALGRSLDYLQPVSCPCQAKSPYAHWSIKVSAAELGKAVGAGPAKEAEVIARTGSGRAARLRIRAGNDDHKPTAVQLRAALGYQRLPSTWFEVHRDGNDFVFEGKGSGHGAGLCQWGARMLAESGKGYKDILAHYYPGTALEKIY